MPASCHFPLSTFSPAQSRYLLRRAKLLILLLAHQFLQLLLRLPRQFNLRNPSAARTSILTRPVDRSWLLLQQAVDFDNLASDGRVDVRCGLDRLDSSNGVASCDISLNGWQLDVDDVAEGVGGVIGDADCAGFGGWGLEVDPLVLGGVLLDEGYKPSSVIIAWMRGDWETHKLA